MEGLRGTDYIKYALSTTRCSLQKMSNFKALSFRQKIIFSIKLLHASVICMQNIREKLITQSMPYQSLYNHHNVCIIKRHNSANTDPSALFSTTHALCDGSGVV